MPGYKFTMILETRNAEVLLFECLIHQRLKKAKNKSPRFILDILGKFKKICSLIFRLNVYERKNKNIIFRIRLETNHYGMACFIDFESNQER